MTLYESRALPPRSHELMNSTVPTPPPEPTDHEPCPTPLAWQEVVKDVLQTARTLEFVAQGVRLEGYEYGSGPPLVFLPTASGTHRLFALTAYLLREDFHCLMLGNPQWEHAPAVSQLIPRTAAVLDEVLSTTFDTPVNLYANGTGVSTALELMRLRPDRVRRAIFQGGGAGAELTLRERMLLSAGLWCPGTLRRVPLWLSIQIQNHRTWFPPFDESRFGFLLGEMRKQSTRDVARRMLADASVDRTADFSAITQPVLLLHGEGEGRQVFEQLSQLGERLPQSEDDAMHTTGLFPFVTHPHRLVKVLRKFFLSPSS
ncbi:MAG: alpha/beta hydrolase [Planctomycetaceae bacterium]|nr:alpha/beta hydrolase [Planctomycetaceae bacterium]